MFLHAFFRKSEHNKMLTCESLQNETGTRLRTSVTLHVLCTILEALLTNDFTLILQIHRKGLKLMFWVGLKT